jgi:hypothetical protein
MNAPESIRMSNFLSPHGALHTEMFLKHYSDHIDTILAMPSGQHAVDPERLEQWIEAQYTKERQETARALASQIQYITHHEVIELCANLVDQLYAALDHSKPIVWWVGYPEKSGYMISLLCYHALKQKDYPEPTGFLTSAVGFKEGVQYIYFDDMSYSGSQVKDLMTKIVRTFAKDSKPFPSIFFGLMSITKYAEESLKVLTVVPYNGISRYETDIKEGKRTAINGLIPTYYAGTTRVFEYKLKTPFPCFYGKVVPSLKDQIGELNYARAMYYFDGENTQVDSIVYFDHKVADSISTFMKVLLYGIVPPYNYSPYGTVDNAFKMHPHLDLYTETFVRDPADKEALTFVPFLNGCTPDEKSLRIWSQLFSDNTTYKNGAYSEKDGLVVRDNKLFKEYSDVVLYHFYRQYENFIEAFETLDVDESTRKSIKDRLGKSDDERPIVTIIKEAVPNWDDAMTRCPFSWYKGFFKGGVRKARKTRKTRKAKAKRARKSRKI